MLTKPVPVAEAQAANAAEPLLGADRKRYFDNLVKEHGQYLHAFLMTRVRDEAEAREVAQEAYVRMLSLEQPNGVNFIRAYLFKIAANIAIDRVRQRQVRGELDAQEAVEEPLDEISPDRQVIADEDIGVLKRALLELPPKCRRAFLLHRFEEWSDAQIADYMGLQPRMVRRYLARAAIYCQLRVQGYSADEAKAESDEAN